MKSATFRKYLSLPASLILVVLTALVVPGVWFFTVWESHAGIMADALARYDKLRAVAAYATVLAGSSPTAQDSVYGELFLHGKTGALVSADVFAQLKQMASTRGVEILRTNDLPPKTEGPIMLVGGSVEMSGVMANIFSVVQDIEAVKPLLFIDHLEMRTDGGAAMESGSDTTLVVDMQVFGAVRSNQILATDTP